MPNSRMKLQRSNYHMLKNFHLKNIEKRPKTQDRENVFIKRNDTITILITYSVIFTRVKTPQSKDGPKSRKTPLRLPPRAKIEIVEE